jgi:NDP-sugar pyrophosphorylase family protein
MSSSAAPRAILLVGGKGTRLRPFTVTFPKALMPLGDVPILEVLIRQLKKAGIADVTLALGHLAELIQAYLDQRSDLTDDLAVRYVREPVPLGTAGALALVGDIDDTFLTMNGDVLTDLDFTSLLQYHHEAGGVLTVATHERQVKIDLGVLEVNDRNEVHAYREKPSIDYLVSMGIYVYEPEVLKYITPNEYLDFPDLVLKLIDEGERVVSYRTDCTWLDIGRPDDYAAAQELFTANPKAFGT